MISTSTETLMLIQQGGMGFLVLGIVFGVGFGIGMAVIASAFGIVGETLFGWYNSGNRE